MGAQRRSPVNSEVGMMRGLGGEGYVMIQAIQPRRAVDRPDPSRDESSPRTARWTRSSPAAPASPHPQFPETVPRRRRARTVRPHAASAPAPPPAVRWSSFAVHSPLPRKGEGRRPRGPRISCCARHHSRCRGEARRAEPRGRGDSRRAAGRGWGLPTAPSRISRRRMRSSAVRCGSTASHCRRAEASRAGLRRINCARDGSLREEAMGRTGTEVSCCYCWHWSRFCHPRTRTILAGKLLEPSRWLRPRGTLPPCRPPDRQPGRSLLPVTARSRCARSTLAPTARSSRRARSPDRAQPPVGSDTLAWLGQRYSMCRSIPGSSRSWCRR
jgi:hypothetical protein